MNGTQFARINGSYSTAFIGTYQVLSQSTSGNSTTFRLYAYFYYGGGTSVGSSSSTFTLDGTQVKSGSYRYYPGYTLLGSKDITVIHNNNGSFPGRSVTIQADSYHMSGSASGNLSASSIARYATITNANNFTDEQNPTVYFTNPANFDLMLRIEAGGNSNLITRNKVTKTSPYTFTLTDEEREILRNLCKNSNSLGVRFSVGTYINSSVANWSYVDKTMTIVNGNPVFDYFEFEDTNEKTKLLTGDPQDVIKGYSNVKVTIPLENKAIAQKSAIMSRYRFSCGDKSTDITYSEDTSVEGMISNVPNGSFSVYAIDSRNNSTLVTKLANREIEYVPLTKSNIDIARNNGVSEEVTLKFGGKIDIVDFGVKTNSITKAQFRYKSTESGSEWSAYQDLTLNVSNGNFSYDGLVKGDTESLGFDVANSYEVEVLVEDELSSVTFTDKFSSGTPNLALAKNGVGIMGKYDEEVGGDLQIRGKNPFGYSEEETIVGTWIDNKPIYRRIFTGTLPTLTGSWQIIITDISNISEIIAMHGMIKNPNANEFKPMVFNESANYFLSTRFLDGDIQVYGKGYNNWNYCLIFEYKKTTD